MLAALQAVPDFYMPLLMVLFYQSWRAAPPAEALAEAKRRLATGQWYEDTEGLVRTHYRPVLIDTLAAAVTKPTTPGEPDPLLVLTHAWPFPKPYRSLHPIRDHTRINELRNALGTDPGRTAMAERILD